VESDKERQVSKETSFTVRDLPRPERPRERLQKFGAEALSAQELLALIIGRGIPKKSVMNIAQELLVKFGNVKAISQATIEELSQIKGIGLAKLADQLLCIGDQNKLRNSKFLFSINLSKKRSLI
jgi:DNA repair protein RadC